MKNLLKKISHKKGFTLIELLIAMSIFLIFTGVLIGSYTSIVRAQREANEYRIMYVEARRVFETIGLELREGMVDYGYYNTKPILTGSICLISKDARFATEIKYDDVAGTVKIKKQKPEESFDKIYESIDKLAIRSDCVPQGEEFILTSEVNIKNFKLYFSPEKDPFDIKNVDKDYLQFQPRVTVFAEFEKELTNGKIYKMDLQTTVSSRIYNQVYSLEKINKL